LNPISTHILFKDHSIVVCNKPAGIPIQEDKTGDASLLKLLEIYTKQAIHLIQRIDRPVSGVVVFAKTKEATSNLQHQMESGDFAKKYFAIVPLKEIEPQGTLTHWIVKSVKGDKSYLSEEGKPGAKKAELDYRILQKLDKYQCLEIITKTGRFHQIRAQLAEIGLPIKGDVKYGSRRGNKDRSILLHASTINFLHPKTMAKMEFSVDPPQTDIWPLFTIKSV
jgi:23S rRNA pseudouridine1911/1915/1917 synthase